VAEAEARGIALKLVRNGSRGMVWLEPLVEVVTPEGRMAFGPMTPADVAPLFEAATQHPKALGRTEDLPWMRRQTRLTFERCGITDPIDLDQYRAHGGLAGLQRAVAMPAAEIVREVTESGLRGRGGAGFPTGIKWKTVLDAEGPQKYIVWDTQVAKKQNDLPVEVALREGGATDYLKEVVLTFKLNLTWPKLHVFFLIGLARIDVVISDKYSFCSS
jgi:hypothetical protein